MSRITIEEVLAELGKVSTEVREGPDGFTMRDYANKLGLTMSGARHHLQDLMRAGRIEYAGKRDVPRMDGVIQPVPVYRLRKAKK